VAAHFRKLPNASAAMLLASVFMLIVARSIAGRCELPLFVFVSHHKAGTHLVDQLVRSSRLVFGEAMRFGDANSPGNAFRHDWSAADDIRLLRHYWRMDNVSFQLLDAGCRPFKMVHVIRDPMELIISAYWYHRKYMDVPFGHETNFKTLQSVSLGEGLEREALANLHGTLREMADVVKLTAVDERVITIGLEDFGDDFNLTVSCVFQYLLERSPWSRRWKSLVDSAQIANKELWSRPERSHLRSEIDRDSPLHPIVATSKSERALAMALIDASTSPVWKEVGSLRLALGYAEQTFGTLRRPMPEVCGTLA